METKRKAGLAAVEEAPGNAADFAYRSLPVDVLSDGTYRALFGPVPSSFDFPKSPAAITFDFHSQFPGTVDQVGGIDEVTETGRRYLEVTLKVTGLDAPCAGLYGWIY